MTNLLKFVRKFTAASYGNPAAVTIRAIHMAESRKGWRYPDCETDSHLTSLTSPSYRVIAMLQGIRKVRKVPSKAMN